jgi:Ca2+-binding RTX toxin-like protein
MFDTEVYLSGDKNSIQSFKGTEGDDKIIDALPSSYLFGGAGNDSIFGGRNHDVIKGDHPLNEETVANLNNNYKPVLNHNDTLEGFCGDDRLVANKGSDYLSGGNGMDVLVNQADLNPYSPDYDPAKDTSLIADDTLTGGKGMDAFHIVFDPLKDGQLLAIGNDIITDFENNRDLIIVDGRGVRSYQELGEGNNVINFFAPDGVELGTLTLLNQDNYIGY